MMSRRRARFVTPPQDERVAFNATLTVANLYTMAPPNPANGMMTVPLTNSLMVRRTLQHIR